MEALVQTSIEKVQAHSLNAPRFRTNVPTPQSWHEYNASTSSWQEATPCTSAQSSPSALETLALYSWNIDFMLPYPDARMQQALNHLRHLTVQRRNRETRENSSPKAPSSIATVIFLAECIGSDLQTIADDPWVQENFLLTDLSGQHWASGYYGTTALVDRRLWVQGVQRVYYEQTRMGRDGLFVDLEVGGNGNGEAKRLLRLCNTHLESMAFEPPFRPPQMRIASGQMREEGVWGAVLAGDLNAIQDFDKTLHADNGLRDAYLELGGVEGTDEGFTWGQQAATALREKFGCSRMDKVFYCGGVEVLEFERFGADVLLADGEEAEHVVKLGFDKPWITDHLGVKAEIKLV